MLDDLCFSRPISRAHRRASSALVVAFVLCMSTVTPSVAEESAPSGALITDVAYGPRPRHRLDLLYPPEGVAARGVVIWGHGGGWVGGTRELSADRANPRWLAEQGWVIASVTYDLSSSLPGQVHSSFPSAIADMQRAVRWARRNQSARGLGAKVLLGGESAGAHLALLAALMHPKRAGLKGRDIVVDGIVAFAPPTNLVRMYVDHYGMWGNVLGAFAGCGRPAPQIGRSACHGSTALLYGLSITSVVPWLKRARAEGLDIPPLYMVGGSADGLLPPRHHVRPLARAWRAATGSRTSVTFDICACDHNIVPAGFDRATLQSWLLAR